MKASYNSFVLSLSTIVVTYLGFKAAVYNGQTISPQGCRMSYMYPEYILQREFNTTWTPLASRYSLWLYREGNGWDTSRSLSGVPVLFLPGNAGSSRQVRSIASSAALQYFSARNGEVAADFKSRAIEPLDFFTAEFNEDFSAFHGPTINFQRDYAQIAVRYILSLYPPGTSIILLGHSMGGLVALSIIPHVDVSAVITLSTPHALPPARYSADMETFYDGIRHRLAINTSTPVVSICAGTSDLMIPSETCRLPPVYKLQNQRTVFTNSLTGCWTSVGHQVSVWCHQVRWRVARALLEMTGTDLDNTRMDILTKWLHDRPALLESSPSSDVEHDTRWATLQPSTPLFVRRPTAGKQGHLLPVPSLDATLLVYVSGGEIAGLGPDKRPRFVVEIYGCSIPTDVPHCEPLRGVRGTIFPSPSLDATFPLPSEGVSESHGVVVAEFDSQAPSKYSHIGVVLDAGSVDETSWVYASFQKRKVEQVNLSLSSLVWGDKEVALPPNRSIIDVHFPYLRQSALLVYRLISVIADNCHDSYFFPTLVHTVSSDERHFLFSNLKPAFLHSHNNGPFLPESHQSSGTSLTIYSDGKCTISDLKLALDYYATFGRWSVRYGTSMIAWCVGVVALIFGKSWLHCLSDAQRVGLLPSVQDSVSLFLKRDLYICNGAILVLSVLPLPETMLLGNRGNLAFAVIGPIIFSLSVGWVYIIAAIFDNFAKFIGRFKNRFLPESHDPQALSRSVLSVLLINGLVATVVPYQVVFVICVLIQLWTCISCIPPKGGNPTWVNYNWNFHIFLLLFWLLPVVGPSLAVWIRTMSTAGTISLFGSDHAVMSIIPFTMVVEYMSRQGHSRLQAGSSRIQTIAITLGISYLVFASFLYGPRYPYWLYDVTCAIYGALLALAAGSYLLKFTSSNRSS